jgi:hypothetical protein
MQLTEIGNKSVSFESFNIAQQRIYSQLDAILTENSSPSKRNYIQMKVYIQSQ